MQGGFGFVSVRSGLLSSKLCGCQQFIHSFIIFVLGDRGGGGGLGGGLFFNRKLHTYEKGSKVLTRERG